MDKENNIGEEFINRFAEQLAKAAEGQKAEEKEELKQAAQAAYDVFESFLNVGFNRIESLVLLQRIMFGGDKNDNQEE